MSEITPDVIAAIATRIFNEIPGAADVPKTTTEVPSLATEMTQWPTNVADNPARTIPAATAEVLRPEVSERPSRRSRHRGRCARICERIRTAPVSAQKGLCTHDSRGNDIQRLFSGKTAPANGARPLDIPAIRRDFPALHQRVHGKPLIWFDNAATTQKPQAVIDAVSSFYAHDNSNIHRGAHTLAARATDAFEQARQKVQTFLGASSSEEIVFVRGTTEGINLVAQSYGRKFLQAGDEIILSTLEHHANIVPWQTVAKEEGPCCGSYP